MKGIQLVGITIGLYLLWITVKEYKNGNSTIRRTIFFSTLWIVMTAFFLNTKLIEILMPILSTKDNVTTALVGGILILFILWFNTFQHLNQLEKKIGIIVQNLALNNTIDKEKDT